MIKYRNNPADYDHCNYCSDTDSMQFSTAHQAYYDRDRDAGHGSSASPLVRTVSAYVQEHLTENITADGIAQSLYLSPNHLSSRFHRESGMTLRTFINQQRISKAKDYLKNTDRSILDISTFLGFSSQAYFQNVFKK